MSGTIQDPAVIALLAERLAEELALFEACLRYESAYVSYHL